MPPDTLYRRLLGPSWLRLSEPVRSAQLWQIRTAGWPWSAFVLCLTNDVVWWIPFALYLHDSWPVFRGGALKLKSG